MPFKTKKQKISAKDRHNFSLVNEKTVRYSGDLKVTKENSTAKKNYVEQGEIADNYNYVQKELFRIIIIAMIIIGFQLALKFSPIAIFK